MKVKIICSECFDEYVMDSSNTEKLTSSALDISHVSCDMTDNAVFELSCNKGHKHKYFISNPKYELLYDMGVSAYLDGYYREACLDFAACIERFHEYCVYAMLCQNSNNITGEIDNMWKVIKNQSERQYGAFVVLYTNTIGKPPTEQKRKWVEFRNDITHKGKIPSKKEAYDYAKYVCEYIKEKYTELSAKNDMHNGVIPKLRSLLEEDKEIRGISVTTFLLSVLIGNSSFEKEMDSFDEKYKLFYEK